MTELLLTGTFWRQICSKWKHSLRGIVGLKYIAICPFRLSFRIGLQMHQDQYKSHYDWLQNVHTLIGSVPWYHPDITPVLCRWYRPYINPALFMTSPLHHYEALSMTEPLHFHRSYFQDINPTSFWPSLHDFPLHHSSPLLITSPLHHSSPRSKTLPLHHSSPFSLTSPQNHSSLSSLTSPLHPRAYLHDTPTSLQFSIHVIPLTAPQSSPHDITPTSLQSSLHDITCISFQPFLHDATPT